MLILIGKIGRLEDSKNKMNINKTLSQSSRPYYDDEKLLEPYNYLLKLKGKNLRFKFMKAFNHWFQISDHNLKIIYDVVELLHNSSLLIDDIQDNSVLRQGETTAHLKFGIPITINCANYVYNLAMGKIIQHFPAGVQTEALKIFIKLMVEAHVGQGLDIYWRELATCPTEEQYCEMVSQKTGGLFVLFTQLMRLFSWDKRDCDKLCGMIGILFQIHDDYANLKCSQYTKSKGLCEDISEGKFSFPFIHAINQSLAQNQTTLLKILGQKTNNVELKAFALKELESYGSFEYTLDKIEHYQHEIVKEIDRLGGNQDLVDIIEMFSAISQK